MTVKPRHLTEEQTEAPSGKGTALSAQGRRAAVLLRRGSIPRGPEVPTALLGKARLGSLRPVLCCRGPRHPALLSGGGRRDTRGWVGANALLRDLPLPPWGRWGGAAVGEKRAVGTVLLAQSSLRSEADTGPPSAGSPDGQWREEALSLGRHRAGSLVLAHPRPWNRSRSVLFLCGKQSFS